MRNLMLFIAFVLPLIVLSQEDKINVSDLSWHLNYESAMEEAQDQRKNLLVYFTGSDWCAPCKMLKKDLFETQEFQEEAADYVLLYIDIPRNRDLLSSDQYAHNKALPPKLNTKNVFPLFAVLDGKEKTLDELSGYNMNGEIRFHMEFMRKNKR